MQNFMKYLKKRGFTLVEALMATVIAGYCILPVIGTLHSGLRQTENFDHREKLRVLARSRLNKELAAAAFNHTNIDKTTSYHYVYYGYPSTLPADTEANPPQLLTYDTALASDSFCPLTLPTVGGSTIATGYATITQILYSYKVSVEVKEQLTIATTTKNITAELLHNLGGLKALVIKAEVEPNINVDSTLIDPLSLFSLLNVPSFGEEHLWVSNPSNHEIISVDPESRAAVANFSLADPTSSIAIDRSARNLAVNPNNKFVAYMGLKNIYALNIDRESPDYGNVKAIWSSSNTSVTNFVDTTTGKTEKAKAMLDRGIAFRPDGKYCFITYHSRTTGAVTGTDDSDNTFTTPGSSGLMVFSVNNPNNWSTLSLAPTPVVFSLSTNEFSCMHPGNDGYLYLALRGTLNQVIRIPMYPDSFSNITPEIIKDTEVAGKPPVAVDTSKEGRFVYILWDKSDKEAYVSRFSSADLAKNNPGKKIKKFEGTPTDMSLSSDGRYLGIVDEDTAAKKGGLFLLDLFNLPVAVDLDLTNTSHFKQVQTEKKPVQCCLDIPATNDFVVDATVPKLYMPDISKTINGDYAAGISTDRIVTYASTDNSIAAMNIREPEYVLVGTSDSNNHQVEYLDINKNKFDKTRTVKLRASPYNIAMSPQADYFKVAYGAAIPGLDLYKFFNQNTAEQTGQGASDLYFSAFPPNKESGIDNEFISLDHSTTTGWGNGIWSGLKEPSDLPTHRDPSDFDLPLGYGSEGKDLVTLKQGGFLVLFTNSTTGNSIIDWIGMHRWGTNSGKFERFARWTTKTDNFPPANSLRMAMSADDRLLAIETKGNPGHVYLYDFSTNNFGPETQLEGFIADYRNTGSDLQSEARIKFGTTSETSKNIKFKECITSRDSWANLQNYPGNFYKPDAYSGAAVQELNANKVDASRRYFGYFIPTQTVKEVAAAVRDTLSLYINNDPLLSYDNNSADGIVKTATELAESSKNTLQLDYTTNGGNIALGLFTRTSLFSLAVAPSVSYTTTGAYDDYITNITGGGFNKVASTSTRPFSFKPTFLQKYELWPLKKSIGMTFSRDVANPILYLISEGGSGCCFVKIIKPGAASTDYKLKDMNLLDNNLVISSDGQRLIFASEDTNKEVMVINISDPQTFAFGGEISQPSSGYGSMIASITMPATPKCLAVKPYNTIKSTSASGTYEVVAQLDNNICGVNNAAVASGGIYIAGGSRAWTAESINTIYKFDPTQKYTAAISPLSKTLPKAVKWHATVAYDDEIYVLNGHDQTSSTWPSGSPTDWVQKFNPTTGKTMSSFNSEKGSEKFQVSRQFSSDPGTTIVNANAYLALGGYKPWKAFDTDTDSTWGTGARTDNDWLCLNFETPAVFNQIKLKLGGGINKPKDITVFTNTSMGITGFTVEKNITTVENDTTQTFNLDSLSHAQKYAGVYLTSNHNTGILNWGNSDLKVLEFWLDQLRRISPTGTPTPVDYTAKKATFGTKIVTWSSADNNTYAGWKVFDGGITTPTTQSWDTESISEWIALDLGSADIINVIRLYCGADRSSIKQFNFQGSNVAAPTVDADWTNLEIGGSTSVATNPDSGDNWNTFHVNNSTPFRHYRIKCTSAHSRAVAGSTEIGALEIEYYSTLPAPVSNPYLSKTVDDNLAALKLRNVAGCATPYGIVIAGGNDDLVATKTVTVYWPHALASYNSSQDHAFGVSRSLPLMNIQIMSHCLVWHKGKLYRIGGSTTGAVSRLNLVPPDVFDFDTNTWSLTSIAGVSNGSLLQKMYPGACSHGDEIFIFGGWDTSNSRTVTVAAWNPETGKVRRLKDLTTPTAKLTAVSVGSSIYLIGGVTNSTTLKTITRFTP